jgi:hypothetical protein
MAPDDEEQLVFEGEHHQQARWQLLLDYRDLADRTYSTVIGIESTPELRFYNVWSFDDWSVTPHGDALPQEGVTDFSVPPTWWDRFKRRRQRRKTTTATRRRRRS